MTVWRPDSTKSGLPGSRAQCSLNRSPCLCRNDRTISSGLVFFDLIARITWLRTAAENESGMAYRGPIARFSNWFGLLWCEASYFTEQVACREVAVWVVNDCAPTTYGQPTPDIQMQRRAMRCPH